MIPNTTQIPNNLFNGEMQKMKDTELRVVLIVARKTLGWIENPETGMRKEEDWISHFQLTKFTGKKSRALSTAIDNCIKKGWIEARDNKGSILDTPQKRAGKKIFYRLGEIFLSKVETPAKSAEVSQTPAKSAIAKSAIAKSANDKRNTITKEKQLQKDITISKEIATEVTGKQINDLIEKFRFVNPACDRLFKNKTERDALERLVKKFGTEKIEKIIEALPKINAKPYAPRVTTPYKLEAKFGELLIFIKKEQEKGPKFLQIR